MLRPPSTVSVSSWVETEMERGLDGLWFVLVPTDSNVHTVDFRFRNGQLVGDQVDDNQGCSWSLPLSGKATEMVQQLSGALEDAKTAGVDVSPYESILLQANISLLSGDYVQLVQVLGNSTRELRRLEVQAIYRSAEAAYSKAVADNVTIPRGELMLRIARESIENGNFDLAKSYLIRLLGEVEKRRATVLEADSLLVVLSAVVAILAWTRRPFLSSR